MTQPDETTRPVRHTDRLPGDAGGRKRGWAPGPSVRDASPMSGAVARAARGAERNSGNPMWKLCSKD